MIRFPLLITAIMLSVNLHAAGGGGGDKDPSPYLELDPDFVLNIGDPEDGRHYVKADIAMRFENAELREKAQVHEPWLRHELVMLLSGQPVERVKSVEGQQKLQKEARKVLNHRLEKEMPKAAQSLAQSKDDEESENKADGEKTAKTSSSAEGKKEDKKIVREVLFEMIVSQR